MGCSAARRPSQRRWAFCRAVLYQTSVCPSAWTTATRKRATQVCFSHRRRTLMHSRLTVCFVRPAKRSLAVTDVPSTVAPLRYASIALRLLTPRRATDVTPAAANTFEIDLNDEMDADQTKTRALQPAALLFPMTELLPVQ